MPSPGPSGSVNAPRSQRIVVLTYCEIAVEHRVLVLVHRHVGQRRGGMEARGLEDAHADARVRNHLHVEGVRHARDLHELRDAGVAHLRLRDRHGAALEPRPILPDGAQLLAERDGNARLRGDLRLSLEILGRARCLDEIRPVRRQRIDELERLGGRELPVQVDHEPGRGTERLAQCAHLLDDALRRHRGRVLERVEPLRREALRDLDLVAQRRAGESGHVGRDRSPCAARRGASRRAGRRACRRDPTARCRCRRSRPRRSRRSSRARASGRRGPPGSRRRRAGRGRRRTARARRRRWRPRRPAPRCRRSRPSRPCRRPPSP